MSFHDIYEEILLEQRLRIERLISANSIYHEISNSKALAVEKLQSQLEVANKVIDIYGFALGVIEGGDDNGDCDTALEAIEQVEKIRNGGEV